MPASAPPSTRYVLLGDGESPHLLKWAQALAPRVELYVASSRGFAPALAALVPAAVDGLVRQVIVADGGSSDVGFAEVEALADDEGPGAADEGTGASPREQPPASTQTSRNARA